MLNDLPREKLRFAEHRNENSVNYKHSKNKMNAHDKFLALKHAITDGCLQKNHIDVRNKALELGFIEADESKSMTLALRYESIETDGISIVLNFRSFDQSKPFQILPDMNKFSLKLILQEKILEEFNAEYED
jgi:hypothetical protein